jgi:hypothetical protein
MMANSVIFGSKAFMPGTGILCATGAKILFWKKKLFWLKMPTPIIIDQNK